MNHVIYVNFPYRYDFPSVAFPPPSLPVLNDIKTGLDDSF